MATVSKKCPCPIDLARRAVSKARTCGDKERAVAALRAVAATRIASRFTSKKEKDTLFKEMLRKEVSVSRLCKGGAPATPAAKQAERLTALQQAERDVKRAMARDAAASEREPLVSMAMDGLRRRRRTRR